jgi:hypothetical protein
MVAVWVGSDRAGKFRVKVTATSIALSRSKLFSHAFFFLKTLLPYITKLVINNPGMDRPTKI